MQPKRVTHSKLSEQALALSVPETAMEPTFTQHMIITVDPNVGPSPGECVLVALVAKRELLFRRYIPKIERKDGVRAPFKLKADNAYFPEREISATEKPVYLGRLVETVIIGSR
ncbi:MAG: S24 family peptidase [Hyphomicrobiales bacterium]|nr:MAG: S24 family peptidase [Hyphomicrobiales bacterium]